eukprot:gene24665-biopygen11925
MTHCARARWLGAEGVGPGAPPGGRGCVPPLCSPRHQVIFRLNGHKRGGEGFHRHGDARPIPPPHTPPCPTLTPPYFTKQHLNSLRTLRCQNRPRRKWRRCRAEDPLIGSAQMILGRPSVRCWRRAGRCVWGGVLRSPTGGLRSPAANYNVRTRIFAKGGGSQRELKGVGGVPVVPSGLADFRSVQRRP